MAIVIFCGSSVLHWPNSSLYGAIHGRSTFAVDDQLSSQLDSFLGLMLSDPYAYDGGYNEPPWAC